MQVCCNSPQKPILIVKATRVDVLAHSLLVEFILGFGKCPSCSRSFHCWKNTQMLILVAIAASFLVFVCSTATLPVASWTVPKLRGYCSAVLRGLDLCNSASRIFVLLTCRACVSQPFECCRQSCNTAQLGFMSACDPGLYPRRCYCIKHNDNGS